MTSFSALTHLTTFELLLPTRKSASFPIVTQKTETPLGIAATIEVYVCALLAYCSLDGNLGRQDILRRPCRRNYTGTLKSRAVWEAVDRLEGTL